MAIRGCNYYTREDDAYYKPSLVEVIDIVIYDTILGLDVLYESKLLANDLWILALGPLVVVSTRITRSELWLAFNEVVCLALADRGHIAFASEMVGYIFYTM
jgi:hypothetical protein